ncbi:MAG: TonB family protein [Betaproteobacteria bacterium]
MTRRMAGGETRSGRPERVRFSRALIVSLLLHASVLMLQAGPRADRHAAPALPGGVIEAHLHRAAPDAVPLPSLPAPGEPQAAMPQPALTATADAPRPPSPATTPAVAPAAASTAGAGAEVAAGAAAGEDFLLIPSLPALPALQKMPRRPSLLAPLRVTYPPNVRMQGGRVRVRILLDESGNVEEMLVTHAVPAGVFDHAALSLLRSARYAPGFVGQMPLRSYLFMEVSFGPGQLGQQVWYAGDTRAPPSFRIPPTPRPAGP